MLLSLCDVFLGWMAGVALEETPEQDSGANYSASLRAARRTRARRGKPLRCSASLRSRLFGGGLGVNGDSCSLIILLLDKEYLNGINGISTKTNRIDCFSIYR